MLCRKTKQPENHLNLLKTDIDMYPNRKTQGFTLIELMVTIAIMGIMAAIAMPSMSNFIANSRIKNRAEQTATLFRFAKGEAVRLNAPVLVCGVTIRSDGRGSGICGGNNYNSGMMAYADQNHNGQYNADVDLSLRTVSVNGSGDQKVTVNFQQCGLTGNCENTQAREFVFMPNGMFGFRNGESFNANGNYASNFNLSSQSIRISVNDASDDQRVRYVVVTPSGSVSVCGPGGKANDGNTAVCQ